MKENRLRSLLSRCRAILLTAVLLSGCVIHAGAAASSGDLLSAADVVLNRKTGGIKSLCVFSGTEGRSLIPTEGKTGYSYVWTGNGARSTSWQITSSVGAVCALTRIGSTHHAAVRVTARQSSWERTRPDEEKILWVNAYNSSSPAIVPAFTQRRLAEHGEIIAFETGIPGAAVELCRDGEAVTTAEADENGYVIFDREHAADGMDHYVFAVYTFGNYDYRAATAYASDPANLIPAGGGTGYEWVANNDCATYVSRILMAGGFPIYAPYTNSVSSPGGSVRHTLVSLTGEAYFKTEFTIEDFHEGDIVWGHDMGHTLYCGEVNREENTIHTYGHSTRAGSALSDNGWAPISELNAVMQLVTEETFDYEYRIGGIAEPRQIVFEREAGGEREAVIAQNGSSLILPECPFSPPEYSVFTGWLADGTLLQPGDAWAVSGHMTLTAQWQDAMLLGIAGFVLPASVRRIEANAFGQSPVESVYIPDGCTAIGPGAFKDCVNLRRIRIPADCRIDETAFDGCCGLAVYGVPGSPAEQLCQDHEDFLFVNTGDGSLC